MRTGSNNCSRCPKYSYNLIRIIGLLLLFIFWLAANIFINIWKKKENNLSILIKILSNYFQILSTTMSFSFKWPTFLTNFLEGIRFVGKGSYDAIISVDCLLKETWLEFFSNSDYIYKTFLSFCLLLGFFGLFLLVTLFWKIVFWKWVNLWRMAIVTIITIQFS